MGQSGNSLASTVIDRQTLRNYEQHFVSPEILQRHDVGIRQYDLARFVSDEIVPRLVRLHTEIVPGAPLVEEVIEALRPDSTEIDDWPTSFLAMISKPQRIM